MGPRFWAPSNGKISLEYLSWYLLVPMKTCWILIQFNPFIIPSQSHFNRLDTICMKGIFSKSLLTAPQAWPAWPAWTAPPASRSARAAPCPTQTTPAPSAARTWPSTWTSSDDKYIDTSAEFWFTFHLVKYCINPTLALYFWWSVHGCGNALLLYYLHISRYWFSH